MPAASLPDHEDRRIASLLQLQILDTPAEAEFDALVEAAAEITGTPISLISLIDTHRQWFKANTGLDGVAQTPRELAFCAHAILDDINPRDSWRASKAFRQHIAVEIAKRCLVKSIELAGGELA